MKPTCYYTVVRGFKQYWPCWYSALLTIQIDEMSVRIRKMHQMDFAAWVGVQADDLEYVWPKEEFSGLS